MQLVTPCVEIARMSACCALAPVERDRPTPVIAHSRYTLPILECFQPISLAEMDAAALMNRVDTKYVLSLADLPYVLEALVDDYWALEVEGVRLSRYATLYFDTPGLDLYASHHMGRSDRYKVRSRWYLDSDASFLEVKRKNNHGRTIKDRIRTEALLTQLTPEASRFVDRVEPDGARPLQSTLWNEFSRLTLVSKHRPERATFDLNLSYRVGDQSVSLGEIVVAEVKQESVDRGSELIAQMRALGVRPASFSKYCVGLAMLRPEVKHNRFKPALRQVDHIMRGDYHA